MFDELANHFGENSVFMDVSAIEPGRDFRKAIDESVASCTVLLAMIGAEWLDTKDAQGRRRLDDPGDFVRIELASALRRDIPVIPVLVRGSKMPSPAQLPDDLKELAYRNAVELSHARWRSDVQVLMKALTPYMGEPARSPAVSGTDAVRAARDGGATVAAKAAAASAPTATIDAQTMERATRVLVVHIGPIAEVVVRRAAKRCSSLEDFYEKLANEIEGDADRARFLKSCRS